MTNRKLKYIFTALIWCAIYTVVNLAKNKTDFIEFMQTKNYIYNLIIYFFAGILVTFFVELREKHKAKKAK
jgi:hypothetical protein